MMRNSVFITLFIVNCAYQMWMVSGQNCPASDQKPPYSDACIYTCIESLYDKEYCNTCSTNSEPIKLKRNETLATLLPYIHVRYDEKKEAIVSIPSCSGCVKETNKTIDHEYVEYVQPVELYEFYDLTFNLTAPESHHTMANHSIVSSVHELYTNLTNRFAESESWCVNALGIEEEYTKFKIAIESETGIDSNTGLPDTNDERTTVTAPINQNNETFANETNPHATPSNKSSDSMDNITKNDNKSSITTEIPEQTTVRAQNETSKMRNSIDETPNPSDIGKNIMSMNKPQLHDHHYHHSVTIITAVSLILLTVLIISIAIIGLYVNRHKNMGAHLTSSRTYVFDHQS